MSPSAELCDVCGKPGVRIRKVARSYGSHSDLWVIEDVPVVSCPNCGESYLTSETLRRIEQIRQDRPRLAISRPVAVATFP